MAMSMLDNVKQPETRASDVLGASSVEWEEMIRQRGSYEAALRIIGAYLETHNFLHASIVEGVDGFEIRHERSATDATLESRHVGYSELTTLDRELKKKRRPFGLGLRRGGHRYEDTLRALGHELDAARAYSLLVDEVDDGFLVTYQFLKPSQSFLVRKRMVFLDIDSVERVLDDAHDRRESFSLLAG
jgi:hypothetical protein